MKKIVIIGSSNTDMVVKSHHIPSPGETVLGGEFMMSNGGKGANQAVAVARLGGEAIFVARVGQDIFADAAIAHYQKYGIDTQFIFRDEAPSGIALIMVDRHAENCISVASGANNNLSETDIDLVREQIQTANIVLMQMEIPIQTILHAARIAENAGVKVILNPAPATVLPAELLNKLYMITPNQTEAEILSGIKVTDMASACQAADKISSFGVNTVIITLGSKGSLIRQNGECLHIPAHKVKATDTTAAGDTFNGALCVALTEGKSICEAVEFASFAAAISVTRMGAQSSIPTRDEVNQLLNKN